VAHRGVVRTEALVLSYFLQFAEKARHPNCDDMAFELALLIDDATTLNVAFNRSFENPETET